MTKSLMTFQQKTSLEMRQKLMMTAHMQQAIRLLQLPIQELDQFLEEQIVLNPVLEFEDPKENVEKEEIETPETFGKDVVIDENDFSVIKQLGEEWQENFESEFKPSRHRSAQEEKLKAFLDSSVQSEISLHGHLKQELDALYVGRDYNRNAAEILIGYVDQSGFLTTPINEIAAFHHLDLEKLQQLLVDLQSLEPFGVAAATVQESLLIQLRCQGKEESLAYTIIKDHYDDLLHHRIRSIQKKLNRPLDEIQESITDSISKLDLHPGSNFSPAKNGVIHPDLTILLENDQLKIEVDREHYHQIRFNHRYLKLLDNPDIPLETKNFIRHHMLSAKWLLRNLQQRYSTLERIAQVLITKQEQFFKSPIGKLLPITMSEVAEELKLHESTIARTVANKYIFTPRGLLSLRSFFTTTYTSLKGESLSGRTIQDAILEIIKSENKKAPLSDEQISALLKKQGLVCARRTVSKHRMSAGIGNTTQRRRY